MNDAGLLLDLANALTAIAKAVDVPMGSTLSKDVLHAVERVVRERRALSDELASLTRALLPTDDESLLDALARLVRERDEAQEQDKTLSGVFQEIEQALALGNDPDDGGPSKGADPGAASAKGGGR